MEASLLGPVIGQRAQFSATKECTRFLRINSVLLPFLVVKLLIRLVFCYFDHKFFLKEFRCLLEKEGFCTPCFSLKCSQALTAALFSVTRVGWPRIGKYAKVLRKYWGVNLGQRLKPANKSLHLTSSFITLRSLCQELAHLGSLYG